MNKRKFQFPQSKVRNYSLQYTNDEFGSLNSFLYTEDQHSPPQSNTYGFKFEETPNNKTMILNQQNILSTQKKRNSLQQIQFNKLPLHSSSQKATLKTFFGSSIMENQTFQIDTIPLNNQSPKVISLKEKKERVIQNLLQVGFEQQQPLKKINENNQKNSDEDIKSSKKLRSISDSIKMINSFSPKNNSPQKGSNQKSKINVEEMKISGKTFAYENYVKGIQKTKQDSINQKDKSKKKGVYDNFVQEKIDPTKPIVILGLSSNYKSYEPSTLSPKEYDYKRHKMRKQHSIVRTAVKYIENERSYEALSNYDKSFQRLKGNFVNEYYSQKNQKLQLSKGDQDIIRRYKDRGVQTAEREKKIFYQNNKENTIQKNIDDLESSDESFDSINSDTRRYKEEEDELKQKIKLEIQNLKNKMSYKNIERQYLFQSKAQTFIKYQQMLDWAKVHDKDKLESVQKFEQKLQSMKSNTSPLKFQEYLQTIEDGKEIAVNQVSFKSQDIMKRVLQLDKIKQSNKKRSNLLQAKNKLGAIMQFKQSLVKNDSLPSRNQQMDFYNSKPVTSTIRNNILIVKKQRSNSEQQLELNSSSSDFRYKTIETPKQTEFISSITSSNLNNSINNSKQRQKIDIKRIQNKIDYKKKFMNGLDNVINDIHEGNYL